eukprot:gene9712-7580_t
MRVDFSLNQFPASGLVKDRCGLPFSCVVQPFSKLDKAQAQIPPADAIARCPKCYSYKGLPRPSDSAPRDFNSSCERSSAPIYIAVVDVSGGEDFLELVRSALLASLEALPPAAQFGLITFSNKSGPANVRSPTPVGLHDVRSPTPCARYIPIFESSPLLVPLAELMPLPALLATVGAHKDSIAAALEALVAEQEATPSSSAPQNVPGNPNNARAGR